MLFKVNKTPWGSVPQTGIATLIGPLICVRPYVRMSPSLPTYINIPKPIYKTITNMGKWYARNSCGLKAQ